MTMKAFIAFEFGYCQLACMFRSGKLNSRVNKLHETVLRIVYQDCASSFTKLLEKDNSATIHNKYIQLLPTELFKVRNGLSLKNGSKECVLLVTVIFLYFLINCTHTLFHV